MISGYDQISRGMRRAILVARHLHTPLPQRRPTTVEHRKAARQRIIRTVEDTIQRQADLYEAEALNTELQDRLDSLDLDTDIATRPIAEIIADICRDFGLVEVPGSHPWKRRTPADIAALNARAAAPSGPPAPPRSNTISRLVPRAANTS